MKLYKVLTNCLKVHWASFQVLAALPISLASLFIVLIIPNCQQSPRLLAAEQLDNSLASHSNVLERPKEGV